MNLRDKPPPFLPGATSLGVDSLNQIVESVPRWMDGDGTVLVNKFGDRTVFSGIAHRIRPQRELDTFIVLQEFPDYLICQHYVYPPELAPQLVYPEWENGFTFVQGSLPMVPTSIPTVGPNGEFGETIESQTVSTIGAVSVAKPYLLQQKRFNSIYTFHGNGLRSSARNNGSNSICPQHLTPMYYRGDIIVARYGPTDLNVPGQSYDLTIDSGSGTDTWVFIMPAYEAQNYVVGSKFEVEYEDEDGNDQTAIGTVTSMKDGGDEITSEDYDEGLFNTISSVTVTIEFDEPITAGDINITVTHWDPVVWQDLNEGARRWSSEYVIKGFLRTTLTYQGSATIAVTDFNGSAEVETGVDVIAHDYYLASGQVVLTNTHVGAFFRSGRWYVMVATCATGG